MTFRRRLFLSLALLFTAAVLSGASAVVASEPCNDSAKSRGKASESAKTDPSPGNPSADESGNLNPTEPTPVPPPTTTPSAPSPARDAAKPARPSKQRPAWPPPPELIA